MMTLPAPLSQFMQGQKLDGLKPFALLFRNKWDTVNNKYSLESTPIDISDMILKPNTLSMTLDVNEVAQYNSNNVTLSLSDTKNRFVEGTPNSYFPDGYQIYGSRVVLYYGLDGVNRTPLFTGVIKELPTHKPENYQVDLKLVSPLEMLKDIEAKDFSDKVTGETLTYKSTDSDGHRIYWTTGTGVGGFDAVYADGNKLFEGVDYETDQLNALGLPAVVTIINSDYYSATITADYYTWKTGLTVEQIVAGLVGLAGYDSATEDIRNVVWNTAVKSRQEPSVLIAYEFRQNGGTYQIHREDYFPIGGYYEQLRSVILNCDFRITCETQDGVFYYAIGDTGLSLPGGDTPQNGIEVYHNPYETFDVRARHFANGQMVREDILISDHRANFLSLEIQRIGDSTRIFVENQWTAGEVTYQTPQPVKLEFRSFSQMNRTGYFKVNSLGAYKNGQIIDEITGETGGILFAPLYFNEPATLSCFMATITGERISEASYRYGNDEQSLGEWNAVDLGASVGVISRCFQFKLKVYATALAGEVLNIYAELLAFSLVFQLVNLSNNSVLEALQDLALISGYEFGINREGVFFFRPRVASTTPTYVLDHSEIVKVDTVKKSLSDFFTKLTLTFAQVPLEFYANEGERPTPVDKYGIINKEIDKPDIVNYDNPELAQAIGPQLLEVYSAMPNIIQVTGKLNLALELGDIVSLRRNMNLITPENFTDYTKYNEQNTYYRACKITGMNYNFSKKQITYTLRDVSNKNTEPQYEFEEYIYNFAVPFGVKE